MSITKWATGVVALVCMTIFSSAAETVAEAPVASQTAHEVIQGVADSMLVLIEEGKGYADEDPERFFSAVRGVLDPVVDFNAIARNVMAAYYKRANEEQRQAFANNFRRGLVRTYALALTEFSGGKIVVVPLKRKSKNPKKVNVKMEIHASSGKIYPVLYSMALAKDGVWRMRNIIINGVNMGLTYRSQFSRAVKDKQYEGDLDRVIASWGGLVSDTGVEGTSAGD